MSADVWFLDTAVACAFFGMLAGMLVPALIARIPEPEPDTRDDAPTDEAGAVDGETDQEVREPKVAYADIARTKWLRQKTALATSLVAALVGARIGWDPALYLFLFLAPVGVALAVVDWRTRLLPTKVIAPSYVAVIVLALFAAWSEGDWSSLFTAGWGWLVSGGLFFVLWLVHPRGMGLGDVRLAGVLGIALGYLGWAELLTGVYAGFLLGGVGGLLLAALRIVDRRALPFGPFMLVGALVGVLVGPAVAAWYV